MEKFLRRRDLPSPLRNAKHKDDPWLQFVCNVTWHSKGARALILNTSESLESGALSHICDHMPVTFPIGPVHQMLRSCTDGSNESSPGNAISLWHEDHTCMTWLDAQPDRSVVYVSYGSLTTMSKESLMQFWVGLVNSGHRFLWVLRSNLVGEEEFGIGAEMEKLVKQGTEERGCIVSWAPQQQVLAHRAVGCFLTHSGWNSTLESMVEGMPMICWPFFADQQLNSRFVSEVWRVGLDMKDASDANTIETTVRAAMRGETAQQLRRNALEFAQQLRKDVSEGGSSFQNFQRLVEYIKSFTHQH